MQVVITGPHHLLLSIILNMTEKALMEELCSTRSFIVIEQIDRLNNSGNH